MTEVTRILSEIESGDPAASEQLLPLVYEELRKLAMLRLAQEKPGQTLQATGLVHEAYIRLVDVNKAQQWNSRGHFFAAAAEAMRRILVEQARRKIRRRRGSFQTRHDFDSIDAMAREASDDVLAVHDALDKFAVYHPEKAAIVKLRYFAGMTLAEAADAIGCSATTADRYWKYARAWLSRELHAKPDDDS